VAAPLSQLGVTQQLKRGHETLGQVAVLCWQTMQYTPGRQVSAHFYTLLLQFRADQQCELSPDREWAALSAARIDVL
jgi:hypothetical protein